MSSDRYRLLDSTDLRKSGLNGWPSRVRLRNGSARNVLGSLPEKRAPPAGSVLRQRCIADGNNIQMAAMRGSGPRLLESRPSPSPADRALEQRASAQRCMDGVAG